MLEAESYGFRLHFFILGILGDLVMDMRKEKDVLIAKYGEDFWFTDLLLLKRFQSVRRVVSLKKRSSLAQIPEIFYDFDNDRTLKALGIDANSKIDKDMLTEGLDLAVRQNSVLMLYAHRPSPAPSSYEVSIELLDYLVAETHKRGMKFYRAKDLYQ